MNKKINVYFSKSLKMIFCIVGDFLDILVIDLLDQLIVWSMEAIAITG